MNDKSFLGSGWSFPPEFRTSELRPTLICSAEDDIEQSLDILLHTRPGERVHNYDYGCDIDHYLFENIDVTTQTLIRDAIQRAVIMFEPRITLDDISFELDIPHNAILIQLDYTIRQTNRRSNIVYPFYLCEGTEIIR